MKVKSLQAGAVQGKMQFIDAYYEDGSKRKGVVCTSDLDLVELLTAAPRLVTLLGYCARQLHHVPEYKIDAAVDAALQLLKGLEAEAS